MKAIPDRPRAGIWQQRFATRMRSLRAHHRLTGVHLAYRCGQAGYPEIDRHVITRIEACTRRLALDEAVVIASVLGVSLEQMVAREPLHVEIKVELP